MQTLEEQLKDDNKTSHEILLKVLENLRIDERGGGPEGLYYTSPHIEGEFLLRNVDSLVLRILYPLESTGLI